MFKIVKTSEQDQFCSEAPGARVLAVHGGEPICGCDEATEEFYSGAGCVRLQPQYDCDQYTGAGGSCVSCDSGVVSGALCLPHNPGRYSEGRLQCPTGFELVGDKCSQINCPPGGSLYGSECYASESTGGAALSCKDKIYLIDHPSRSRYIRDFCAPGPDYTYYFNRKSDAYQLAQCAKKSCACAHGELLLVQDGVAYCAAYDTTTPLLLNCNVRTAAYEDGELRVDCLRYQTSKTSALSSQGLIAIYTVISLVCLIGALTAIVIMHRNSAQQKHYANFVDYYGTQNSERNLTSSQMLMRRTQVLYI